VPTPALFSSEEIKKKKGKGGERRREGLRTGTPGPPSTMISFYVDGFVHVSCDTTLLCVAYAVVAITAIVVSNVENTRTFTFFGEE